MDVDRVRRELMTTLGSLHSGVGLEVGPLARPVALKSLCNVQYVDVFDATHLREHYRNDSNVNVADIPDLDYCLHTPSGKVQSLGAAVAPGAPYDWVLASHVVEHVPDLIGWLSDIAEIIKDDGRLILAIPDKRYTFDVLRPATTVGQILLAHRSQDVIPSIRAVYDHFRSNVNASAADLWNDVMPTADDRAYSLDLALDQVRLATDEGRYVDAHVWVFTPSLFAEQIAELGRMNLIDFYVESIVPTACNELEFYALLRRLPRGLINSRASELDARAYDFVSDHGDPAAEPRKDPALAEAQQESDDPSESPPDSPQAPDRPTFQVSDREIRLILVKRKVLQVLRKCRIPLKRLVTPSRAGTR